jgi:hypothetical protein
MKVIPGLRLVLVVTLAALTVACVILFLGTVQPARAELTGITVQAAPNTLIAKSEQTATITAIVTGNPVSDVVVTFSLSADNLGSVMPQTTTTDINGQVTATWTAGTVVGSGTLYVTDGVITEGAPVTLTVGAATTVTLAPASAVITAGQSMVYATTATDTYGNSWDATSTAGYTITPAAGGSWNNNVYTSQFASPTPWTITGTVDTLPGTATLTVNAAAPQTVTVQVNPATQIARSGTTSAITVTVVDTYTNLVPGVPLTSSLPATLGMVSSLGATDSSGQSFGTWTASAGTMVGSGMLQVGAGTAVGIAPVTLTFGVATTITVQVNPATLIAKSSATSIITATAFDLYDNLVAGVTPSGSTSPSVLGDVSDLGTTNASGLVTGTWTAGNYIEVGVLNVTNGSITGSAPITLTAGPPYSVTLQPDVPSTVVTTIFVGLTARVKDQFGNWVTDGTTVTFATSLGDLWRQQWTTTGGSATSGIRSTQSGIATITATSGSAQPATTTVTFTPDVPYSVTLQANPVTPTVGSNSVLTATAYDQYHNVVDNVVTVTFSSNLGNLAPTVVTTTNGVATSRISDTLTGPRFITATSQPPALAGTATVTFMPDIPFTVTLTAQPITQTVGVNSTLNVTVTDRFGNWVADSTPITFTRDLTSSIVSPVTTTNGIATSLISSTVAGTAHITAANGLARSTAVVTFTPDVPFTLALQATPISLTVGNSSVLTATVRDRFSNLVTNGTLVTFTRDLTSSIVSPVTTMNGVATSRITSTVAGTAHITATSGSAWNTMVVTFTPGAPMTITVLVNPPNLRAGSDVTAVVTATVLDLYNNPVPGVALTGTVPITLGTVSGLGTTNPDGQAFGAWKAGTTAGSGLLSVGNSTVTGTTSIAVLANDPSTVVVQVISPTLFANSGMTTSVTATVRDVHDNLIPGVVVNFSLSSPTLGSVIASGSTNAYGQAFSVYTASVPSEPGSGLLIACASYDSSYVCDSAPVTLTADVPCTLTLQAVPTTQVVGINSVLTATITDRFGNDVANDTSVTFATDLGYVSSPQLTTSGTATSPISSTLVGTAHITATSGTAQDTAAVSFVPDVPSIIELQAQPISQTVGLSSVLTATVYDRFSNLVADNTTVTFTKDLTGTILSPRTTMGGVATSRVTITLASVAYITATSGAAWRTTAITFMPDIPATTTVQLGTDTLIVNSNTTTTVTATVVDRYYNLVPGVPVTGSLVPPTLGNVDFPSLTNPNGQTFGTWTAGTIIGEGTLVVGNGSAPVRLVPWRVFAPVVMKDFPPKPVGTLLRINAGADYTYQVTAALEVSATVQQDYVEWMRFSNDNVQWGDWIAFALTTTWNLASNNGLATVYAQFRGHGGGISAAISDDILLFKNGDFSQPNLADWTLDPNSKLNVSAAVDPASGSPSGLLGDPAYVCDGGVPVGFGSLSQSFTMPPTGRKQLRLEFSYQIHTQDRNYGATLDFDRFEVQLNGTRVLTDANQSGSRPYTCGTIYHLDRQVVSVPVVGSPGSNINVTFFVWNWPDGLYNTYVYLDDVHLRFE